MCPRAVAGTTSTGCVRPVVGSTGTWLYSTGIAESPASGMPI